MKGSEYHANGTIATSPIKVRKNANEDTNSEVSSEVIEDKRN